MSRIIFIENQERIYCKREKSAFRCMRALQWDSLAGQIYLREDLYLKGLTAIHKIMACTGHCAHLIINLP